ncbi:MAG: SDR family NAD(P)-dependent oxidoreductase [Peptococcaceae bacterium]|nr:SDR family NAD(P)-dependent oxidoreductase [Peptococcaceae bacterium]
MCELLQETVTDKVYLVTGAAGFLGGAICRELLEKGADVRALVLPNDPAKQYVPENIDIVEGDICDMDSLRRFFDVPEGVEKIVMHIASIVTVNPEYSQKVMDVNFVGTGNIIKMCLEDKEHTKLVYCSSTGAIPELPMGQAIKEVSRYEISTLKDCYSQSKALASQAVLDAVERKGLHACVILPSGILGPDDPSISETTKTVIEIIKGEMPAGIDGTFNLCDVRDLAHGAILAAEKGKDGNSYILGNDAITFKQFAKVLMEESGCEPIKFFLPVKAAYLMGTLMEKAAKLKGSKPLMTSFSVYNLARNNVFDSSKAKVELGYTTRPYEETIHDQVQWLKAAALI